MHQVGYQVPQGAAGRVIIAWYRAVPITQKMPFALLLVGDRQVIITLVSKGIF